MAADPVAPTVTITSLQSRAARVLLGLTPDQLARAAGVDVSVVAAVEAENTCDPGSSSRIWAALAKAGIVATAGHPLGIERQRGSR